MTEKELKLKEKLSLILDKIEELKNTDFKLLTEVIEKKGKLKQDILDNILYFLCKVKFPPNYSILLDDERNVYNIYRELSGNQLDLIYTISVLNIPNTKIYSSDDSPLIKLRTNHIRSSNNYNLEEEIIKLNLIKSLNNYIEKNEYKLLKKINNKIKNFNKFYSKKFKRYTTLSKNLEKLNLKLQKCILPLFLKDIKNKGIVLDPPSLINLPSKAILDVTSIKLQSDSIFIFTTNEGIENKVELENPQNYIKDYLVPLFTSNPFLIPIYPHLFKRNKNL